MVLAKRFVEWKTLPDSLQRSPLSLLLKCLSGEFEVVVFLSFQRQFNFVQIETTHAQK